MFQDLPYFFIPLIICESILMRDLCEPTERVKVSRLVWGEDDATLVGVWACSSKLTSFDSGVFFFNFWFCSFHFSKLSRCGSHTSCKKDNASAADHRSEGSLWKDCITKSLAAILISLSSHSLPKQYFASFSRAFRSSSSKSYDPLRNG